MLLLPTPPTRGSLRAFWLVASLGMGTAAVVPVAFLSAAPWWLTGAVVAVGVAVPGMVRPMRLAVFYRAWNRVVRAYADSCSRLVTAVCFWTVFLAVGRGVGPTQFVDAGVRASMWVPRRTQAVAAYDSEDDREPAGSAVRGWAGNLWTWSTRSRNRWAVALFPFLWVLQMLDTSERDGQDDLPADVYTLY